MTAVAEKTRTDTYWSSEFEGFTIRDLKEAFDEVTSRSYTSREDWRGPIHTTVHEDDLEITKAAILFFTATDPEVRWLWTPDDRKWEIKSIGYRNGPAGP